eukprot:10941229-Heterocapsa_arctica.AAC.1
MVLSFARHVKQLFSSQPYPMSFSLAIFPFPIVTQVLPSVRSLCAMTIGMFSELALSCRATRA